MESSFIFYDSEGNLLKNTNIRFNFTGAFYDKITDDDGKILLGICLSFPGNHVMNVINPISAERYTVNIKTPEQCNKI